MSREDTENLTTAQLLLNLIASGMEPVVAPFDRESIYPGQIPGLIVPEGCDLKSLEVFQPVPARVRESIVCDDVHSFLKYWNHFKTSSSVIFADKDSQSFRGIIDYHHGSDFVDARNCDHTLSYTCPKSKEWNLWTNNNKKSMTQQDFAQFIEDNTPDITAVEDGPSAADMMELAMKLEINKKVQYKSSQKLESGEVQLTYNEEIKGTSKTGQMKIPEKFFITIPVFRNGPPYIIKARLRYRLSDGTVRFWYDLYRHDRVIDHAFDEVFCTIAEGKPGSEEDGIPGLAGTGYEAIYSGNR